VSLSALERGTDAAGADPAAAFPIVRNTVKLAACLAVNSTAFQLSVALATTTFVLVTGVESLLGLGPALFLGASAAAALVGGRAMDRFGRVPVLAAGFVLAMCGNALTALGAWSGSSVAVVLGLLVVGSGQGTVALSRAAGGDLYPPERRARGISYVLFGSVFGAVLGPAVFVPLFSGRELTADSLVVPWLAASAISAAGFVVALSIRPDPRRIAQAYAERAAPDSGVAHRKAPLSEILRRPGVPPALAAGLASFVVMVVVMNLTGHLVTDDRGHDPAAVFPIISAHVAGMFGLVLVVGDLVDRLGRRRSLVGGLALVSASVLVLAWVGSVAVIAVALFGLGLGWAFSFVAASAELVDRSGPLERGTLLGFHDLCAGALAALCAIGGGYLLGAYGPLALALAAALVAALPAVWIFSGPDWRARGATAAGTLRAR
jgi:MFS family permease